MFSTSASSGACCAHGGSLGRFASIVRLYGWPTKLGHCDQEGLIFLRRFIVCREGGIGLVSFFKVCKLGQWVCTAVYQDNAY